MAHGEAPARQTATIAASLAARPQKNTGLAKTKSQIALQNVPDTIIFHTVPI